jgi:hypothetical protein
MVLTGVGTGDAEVGRALMCNVSDSVTRDAHRPVPEVRPEKEQAA